MIEQNIICGNNVVVDNPLQETYGHVLAETCRAVVIQNDTCNTHGYNLIVTYNTTNLRWVDIPANVMLQWYDRLKPCLLFTGQIQAINKTDVIDIVGHLRE